ncbi:basic proline-rich protein-like [Onychomys torridus]|uniref:basic proline-rich protein-like n=1 Tax=Onychomys torridus TaxID=38674 RepID=UPI00167F9704|nr:basic proline-rich protein-like [Onychomys torridus]
MPHHRPPGFRCCAVSGADHNPESGSDPALHIPQAGKAPGPCPPRPHRAPPAAPRAPRPAPAWPPPAPPAPAPVRPPRRLFFVTVAGAVGDRSQNPAGFRSRSRIALRPPGSAAAGLASALGARPRSRAHGPRQLPPTSPAHANPRPAACSRARRPPAQARALCPGASKARPGVAAGSGPYSPFPATRPPYPVFGRSPGRGLGLQPLWCLRKSEAAPWLPGPDALLASTLW